MIKISLLFVALSLVLTANLRQIPQANWIDYPIESDY